MLQEKVSIQEFFASFGMDYNAGDILLVNLTDLFSLGVIYDQLSPIVKDRIFPTTAVPLNTFWIIRLDQQGEIFVQKGDMKTACNYH